MFRKLKRKFILTNLLTSSAVLVIAFTSIYLIASNTTIHRENKPFEQSFFSNSQKRPELDKQPDFSAVDESIISDFNQEMLARIEDERKASLQTLLISLIITGISVEIIIAIISFYLAEQSIKPVREAYLAQKDFVANASHEIKTPLAVIQANLEAADIKGNQWIDNVAKKTEDLTNLNNQLLTLARTESIVEESKLTEIDLEKIISKIINEFLPKAESKGKNITLKSKLESDDPVKINLQAFEQILNIYIDNAIKYSKKNVSIEIYKDQILVLSDGKLIEKEKIPHLFERFYQADKTSSGVGLGLAIAKTIAEKNNWEVSAKVDSKLKKNIFILNIK